MLLYTSMTGSNESRHELPPPRIDDDTGLPPMAIDGTPMPIEVPTTGTEDATPNPYVGLTEPEDRESLDAPILEIDTMDPHSSYQTVGDPFQQFLGTARALRKRYEQFLETNYPDNEGEKALFVEYRSRMASFGEDPQNDQAAREIREMIIEGNLLLVASIASKERTKRNGRYTYDELFQYGVIGLIRAVDKYDPSHESTAKFSTYARSAIVEKIYTEIKEHNIIRIPHDIWSVLTPVMHAIADLQEQGVTHPSDTQIAAETGLDVQQISKVRAFGRVVISTDNPLSDEPGSPTILDLYTTPGNLETRDRTQTLEDAQEALAILWSPGRFTEGSDEDRNAKLMRHVVELRVGLATDDSSEMSFQQIGKMLGVSEGQATRLYYDGLRLMRSVLSGQTPRQPQLGLWSQPSPEPKVTYIGE